jgi:hypothetical protein
MGGRNFIFFIDQPTLQNYKFHKIDKQHSSTHALLPPPPCTRLHAAVLQRARLFVFECALSDHRYMPIAACRLYRLF